MTITIDFLSNVRNLLRGTDDAEEAFEDVADSLNDLARDSQKAGDKLGDNISDGAKDAEKGVDRLERSFKELADESRRASKSGGDDLGKNYKKGTDEAGEGLKDFKQEANSTAKESAASFDGSAESITDVFQEIAANAFEGFGPAGAAAGIAAAVGIGLVTSAFQQAGEETEAYREQVKGLVDQLFEVEGNTKLLDYVGQLRDFLEKGAAGTGFIDQMADFWEQNGTNFDQAQRDAKNYKVDLVDLLKSYSGGDAKTAQATIEKLQKAQEALRNSSDYRMKDQYAEQARAIDGVIDRIKAQNALTDDAVTQYEAISAATNEMAAEQEAAAAAIEAVADAASSLQGELDEAVSSFDEFKNAEGALDPAGYIASIQARSDATSNFNTNVQGLAKQFGLSNDEIQALLDQGLDFAPMLQSIIDSGLAPQFVTQLQNAVGGGQDILDGNPLSTEVAVKANVTGAERDLESTSTKPRATEVKVKTDTRATEAALDGVAAKPRTARIGAYADLGAAEGALDRLAARARNVRITATVVDRNGKVIL